VALPAGPAGALRPLRRSLWSARPLVRGCACGRRVRRHRSYRRSRGRRACVVGARRLCEGSAGVSRSRPFSAQVWYRKRNGNRLRQRVRQILDGDEPESDEALSVGDRLRRPAALGARDQLRGHGRGEAQAAAGTGDVRHDRPLSKETSESALGPAGIDARAASRRRSFLGARAVCVAVAMADRLSALLSGNVAPKARRAGLTERSPRLARPNPRTSNSVPTVGRVAYTARVESSSPPLGVSLSHASCGPIPWERRGVSLV
jgi:hypothetical protein